MRHDPLHRFELLDIRQGDKAEALLPIWSDQASAATSSPLAPFARPQFDAEVVPSASTATLAHISDVASHLLTPSGPWRLSFNLQLPDCSTSIRFSNKHPGASVVVVHMLKVIFRVARGDEQATDSKGKRKQYDITVEIPVHLLSVRFGNSSCLHFHH